MLNPFMTLDDNTQIVHSETLPDGQVRVCIEQPIHRGFNSATCMLPSHLGGSRGIRKAGSRPFAGDHRRFGALDHPFCRYGRVSQCRRFLISALTRSADPLELTCKEGK